jgi:hypothetical protein
MLTLTLQHDFACHTHISHDFSCKYCLANERLDIHLALMHPRLHVVCKAVEDGSLAIEFHYLAAFAKASALLRVEARDRS